MADETADVQQENAPQAEVSTTKDVDTIVDEILAGRWGRGQARRQKLREAGVDVDAVEKAYKKVITRS